MAERRPVGTGPIARGFAARLCKAREAKGWSQTALAQKSGLTRQRVVYFENGNAHPSLIEVEQLASTLGLSIQALLGIEPASHPAFPRQMLEDLARHFRGAADGLDQLLRAVADEALPASVNKPAKKPALEKAETLAPAKGDRWPWIISNAEKLLQEDPRRVWNRVELCDALKAQGVRPVNTRGMHMAIMPRLRAAGLITEKKNGTFTARLRKAEPAPRPAPKAKMPAASRRTATPATKATTDSAAIDALAAAARPILEADPARSWKPIEFVQAIRASGVQRDSWRGVHFYLPKHLKEAGLIEIQSDGRFTASGQPTQAKTEERFAARESRQAMRPGEPSIIALAQEIDALAPRLTDMTPRERTAQLAAWAGRVRQMDEELTGKKIPTNSGLRGQLKMILARIIKLRKSLGCGWVDALSFAWSTNWKIYVEHNRATAASEPSTLSAEQKKIYFHDLLKSILTVRQSYARDLDAPALVIEAALVLDDTDPLLIEAKKKFGNHHDRRAGDSRPSAPFRRQGEADQRIAAANRDANRDGIPRSVLKITRGRTLLIAGGRGSHDTQRLAVKKGLQFKVVDWITGERHPNPTDLFSMAIRNKRYDLVLLMPGTDDTEPLVMACKEAGSRLMYLTRGPSIPSVAEAVSGQQVVGGEASEWIETR